MSKKAMAERGTGQKMKAIVAWYEDNPGGARADCATAVECTVQRVGEVIRAGLVTHPNTRPPAREGYHRALKQTPQSDKRTGRCEHERARKARTGTCKVCPPVAA